MLRNILCMNAHMFIVISIWHRGSNSEGDTRGAITSAVKDPLRLRFKTVSKRSLVNRIKKEEILRKKLLN